MIGIPVRSFEVARKPIAEEIRARQIQYWKARAAEREAARQADVAESLRNVAWLLENASWLDNRKQIGSGARA